MYAQTKINGIIDSAYKDFAYFLPDLDFVFLKQLRLKNIHNI